MDFTEVLELNCKQKEPRKTASTSEDLDVG
jgi:hypothetical protein